MPEQHVVFGAERVKDLPEDLARLGLHRLLLIATGSMKHAGDDLDAELGDQVVGRIDEATQHVPVAEADSATATAERQRADGVVVVGGGSAIGLGKAVAVRTGLPLVVVPTTYSGSEATDIYAVTTTHKTTARDPHARAGLVVYDPALTLGMPRHVTATSGLNAMAHCVEAMYAAGANPVSDLVAEEGLRVLDRALPAAYYRPSDLPARSEALYGAYLAGSATSGAGSALHHLLCHVIGGTYRLGHGDLHAVLLPYVVAYNAEAAQAPLARVATALGTPDPAAGLRDFGARLDAPTDLHSLGLPEPALDDIVERTLAVAPGRNPREPDAASLRRLLDDAYAGTEPDRY